MGKSVDEAHMKDAKDQFIFGIHDEVKDHRYYPSLSEVADNFGVSKNTIYKRAKEEKWQEEKNRIHNKIERERNDQKASMMLEEAERLDRNSIKVSQGAIIAAGKVIQAAVTNGIGHGKDQISPSDFQRVVNSVANAQRVGKLALGEAQFISKVTSDADIPDPLREILEQLDEFAETKSSGARHTLQ